MFTMTNIVAKHPWVFSFFILVITFFLFIKKKLFYQEREGDPYFHWNSTLHIQNIDYFHWNNSIYTKNKKKNKQHNTFPYLNLSKFFGGDTSAIL